MEKKCFWRREKKNLLLSLIVTIIIAYIFYNSIKGMVLLPIIYLCLSKTIKEEEQKKKKEKLKGMYRDMILSLAAALQGGYSVERAMEPVNDEMKLLHGENSPIAREMNIIIQKIEANHPIERAFEESAKNMDIDESKVFAETFKIGKRIGGDMNRIIMDTVMIISEKIDTDKEIESNLAAKRFEFRIMFIMPFAMISYVRLSSPGYFEALYKNLFGVMLMTFVLVMMVCAYKIAKKTIEIQV